MTGEDGLALSRIASARLEPGGERVRQMARFRGRVVEGRADSPNTQVGRARVHGDQAQDVMALAGQPEDLVPLDQEAGSSPLPYQDALQEHLRALAKSCRQIRLVVPYSYHAPGIVGDQSLQHLHPPAGRLSDGALVHPNPQSNLLPHAKVPHIRDARRGLMAKGKME